MDRTRLAILTLLACAAAFACDPHKTGSSIYVPSPAVGVDLTAGGQVQGISGDGGTQLAVIPGNIQFVNPAIVNITESAPTSDVAPVVMSFTAQPPFASATTNFTPIGFTFNLGTQVNGNPATSTSRLTITGDSTNLFAFGGDPLSDVLPMFWLGQAAPSSSNYAGFLQSGVLNLNASTGVDLRANTTVVVAVTTGSVAITGAETVSTTLGVAGAFNHTSPQTIACGTGGTQAVASSPSSGLIVTSGTLSSNCTIDFSTNASSGEYTLDMGGVTLGTSFGVIFKNGTTSSATFLSGSVITTGDTMAHVWTHGANTLAVTY